MTKLMYTIIGECGTCHYLDLDGDDEKEFLRLRKIMREKVSDMKNFLISKGMPADGVDFWGDMEEMRQSRENFHKKFPR